MFVLIYIEMDHRIESSTAVQLIEFFEMDESHVPSKVEFLMVRDFLIDMLLLQNPAMR